jgi:hypothetical protein
MKGVMPHLRERALGVSGQYMHPCSIHELDYGALVL